MVVGAYLKFVWVLSFDFDFNFDCTTVAGNCTGEVVPPPLPLLLAVGVIAGIVRVVKAETANSSTDNSTTMTNPDEAAVVVDRLVAAARFVELIIIPRYL